MFVRIVHAARRPFMAASFHTAAAAGRFHMAAYLVLSAQAGFLYTRAIGHAAGAAMGLWERQAPVVGQ